MAVRLPDPLGSPLFLGHAAAEDDDLFRVFPLRMGEGAQIAEDPLFCMFPDGAGVQQDQIRLLGVLSKGKAAGLQHSHQPLAVSDILLTAEGLHTGGGVGLAALEHGPNLLLEFPLAGQICFWD